MKYSAVIFDLDGTLLDTLDDLKNAVTHALAAYGAPGRSREEVRLFVGNGVANLIKRAMPEGSSDKAVSEALTEFRAYYNSHMDVETKPYPGISEMLSALKAAGVTVCVNSNKYDAAVKSLCAAHFDKLFDYALGESTEVPKKPSPVAALRLLEMTGCPKEKALYVGDSAVDVQTAKNAGLDMAWVSWGFRTRDEMGDALDGAAAFDSAQALAEYILGGE